MEEIKEKTKSFGSVILTLLAFVAFILGLQPIINFPPEWKMFLLSLAPATLAIACFYTYLENQDRIDKEISQIRKDFEINKRLIRLENLVELLKNE